MTTAADRGAELTACAVFGPISELTVPGLEGRVELLSDVEEARQQKRSRQIEG